MGFVQGFLAILTLDGNVITLFVTDVALSRARTALDKTVMDGTGDTVLLPGLKTGTLSMSGHIDQANLNALEVTLAKDTVVTFALEVNEGLGTDAQWTGSIAITQFDTSTTFDGNWAFTLSGDTSGATTYVTSIP